MKVRKITYGGLLIAAAILIPQLFHLTGIPKAGQIFLPMHIPVLLGGFMLGPAFGVFIGVVSPMLSAVITGMPAMDRLPFMIIELGVYGIASGVLYNLLNLRKIKGGIYLSLLISMTLGRAAYALSLFIAADFLGIPCGGAIAAVTATISGVYGIIIQFILIPTLIIILERSGYLNAKLRKSHEVN